MGILINRRIISYQHKLRFILQDFNCKTNTNITNLIIMNVQ